MLPAGTAKSFAPLDKPFKPDTAASPCCAAISPGRRRAQAVGRLAASDEAIAAGAVVFENIEDYHARIEDPDLDSRRELRHGAQELRPSGYPGMAEVGNMALPPKILKKGITDMVRISDARMSGTAYGTVVLHAAPEAAAGGTAGARPQRRHDRARCGSQEDSSRSLQRRVDRQARGVEKAGTGNEGRISATVC